MVSSVDYDVVLTSYDQKNAQAGNRFEPYCSGHAKEAKIIRLRPENYSRTEDGAFSAASAAIFPTMT